MKNGIITMLMIAAFVSSWLTYKIGFQDGVKSVSKPNFQSSVDYITNIYKNACKHPRVIYTDRAEVIKLSDELFSLSEGFRICGGK